MDFIASTGTFKTTVPVWILALSPFPFRLSKSDFCTWISYPRKCAFSSECVISVFSWDISKCRISFMNLVMSSFMLTHSALVPITPIRKSSAYLTYFNLLYFSSMLIPYGMVTMIARVALSLRRSDCLSVSPCATLSLRWIAVIRFRYTLYSGLVRLLTPLSNSWAYCFIYLSNLSR